MIARFNFVFYFLFLLTVFESYADNKNFEGVFLSVREYACHMTERIEIKNGKFVYWTSNHSINAVGGEKTGEYLMNGNEIILMSDEIYYPKRFFHQKDGNVLLIRKTPFNESMSLDEILKKDPISIMFKVDYDSISDLKNLPLPSFNSKWHDFKMPNFCESK